MFASDSQERLLVGIGLYARGVLRAAHAVLQVVLHAPPEPGPGLRRVASHAQLRRRGEMLPFDVRRP